MMDIRSDRAGFGTLTMIALIVMLLLVTGIGQAVWRHGTQIGTYCRDMMLSVNFNAGLDACDTLGRKVANFQRYLEYQVGSSSFGDTMNLEEFAGYIAREFSSKTLGYSSPQLSNFINPSLLQQGSNNLNLSSPIDRLSMAITQGAQGSALLSRGNSAQGLGFLQSSASMGDVGVLSQLQLGSAYAQGTSGLPADPGRAKFYYQQALQSIQSLQQSPSPASKQLLGALPASPDAMKMQLHQIVSQ